MSELSFALAVVLGMNCFLRDRALKHDYHHEKEMNWIRTRKAELPRLVPGKLMRGMARHAFWWDCDLFGYAGVRLDL